MMRIQKLKIRFCFVGLFLLITNIVFVIVNALSSSSSSPQIKSQFQEQKLQLPNGITGTIIKGLPSSSNQVSNNNNNNPFAAVFNQNSRKKDLPVLVFLHGSFHGAWCWEEHFMPYFLSNGYPVVAFNWRGTSGTPAGDGIKKVKASEHCQDLQGLLDLLPDIVGSSRTTSDNVKPILLSHSFGGIVVMKYLEEIYNQNQNNNNNSDNKKLNELFSGLITMCSVPPSGNGKLTLRYLQRSLKDSWKITAGFAMKKCITDKSLCRDLFFGGQPIVVTANNGDGGRKSVPVVVDDDFGISDNDIERYQTYFKKDTDATIDLIDLGKQLPSFQCDKDGKAQFVNELPPTLVIGAKDDFIVDEQAVIETATYFGLDSAGPTIVDSPHDVMVGRKWQNTADTILKFIEKNIV